MATTDITKGLTLSAFQLILGSRSIAWLVVASIMFLVVLVGMAAIRHVANPVFRAWGKTWAAQIRKRSGR